MNKSNLTKVAVFRFLNGLVYNVNSRDTLETGNSLVVSKKNVIEVISCLYQQNYTIIIMDNEERLREYIDTFTSYLMFRPIISLGKNYHDSCLKRWRRIKSEIKINDVDSFSYGFGDISFLRERNVFFDFVKEIDYKYNNLILLAADFRQFRDWLEEIYQEFNHTLHFQNGKIYKFRYLDGSDKTEDQILTQISNIKRYDYNLILWLPWPKEESRQKLISQINGTSFVYWFVKPVTYPALIDTVQENYFQNFEPPSNSSSYRRLS
jgi:hypothetical protein